jgi:aromatic ring-cleaving dioxygenase
MEARNLNGCAFMSTPIPAVWRIDVEPDEHQPDVQQKPWRGFVAMTELVEGLRDRLAERSGHVVHPTWFVRLDPDIERCFGQVDFVVRRHQELFDQLIAHKDPLGIHVHPQRWDEERSVAFADYADNAWTTHCLTVASDAFADRFGEPVRRSSQGGYFLTETVLDSAIALGIKVDVTVEPGLPPKTADPSFGAYATAASGDFRNCPRQPYYPSLDSMMVPSSSLADCRPILIVPLTAYDYQSALTSWPRRIAKKLLRRPRHHSPLNPWKEWPSPKVYWDLVAQATDEQAARYFAFAIRTDAPESRSYQRVRTLLEHLPSHPISARLQFVDPLGPEIHALATPSRG